MHAWGLRLRRAAPHSRFRASLCCLPVALTPSASLNLAISELTTSGYPAYMCLFPTLQVHPLSSQCPHMGRGQDGSLLLSCMTLSFTTPRRFIPTLSKAEALAPQRIIRICGTVVNGQYLNYFHRRTLCGGAASSISRTVLCVTG